MSQSNHFLASSVYNIYMLYLLLIASGASYEATARRISVSTLTPAAFNWVSKYNLEQRII